MAEEPIKPPPPPPEAQPPESRPALDEASASLADALQTSFRILTFLILGLLALFLTRGFFTVPPDQKAIILRFGRADANLVRDVGLHYALPYPIDSVVRIPVSSKKLQVNTFWPVTAEEEKKESLDRPLQAAGPVRGAEGAAMLTGDRNILEARWDITYRIRREPDQAVIDFFKNIGLDPNKSGRLRDETGAALPAESNDETLVRAAVQSAVVRELGRAQVADIYPNRVKDPVPKVWSDVKATIDGLNAGLEVQEVNLIEIRPPKQVKQAFDEKLKAITDADAAKAKADQDRQQMLIEAAGAVGVAALDADGHEIRPGLGNEIEKWWAAKSSGDAAQMQKSEAVIRDLFQVAGGQVRTMIAEAKAYQISVKESAKGDAAQVQSLADLLETSPREVKIFLDHARVDALQEFIAGCYEVFLYHPEYGQKSQLDLWLNRRGELLHEKMKVEPTR